MTDTAPFWEAVESGQIAVQTCAVCGHHQLYARDACTNCHERKLSWTTSSGSAVVYSYTVVRRAPSPQFATEIPYVLGLIELDEGPRILVRILQCEPDEVRVGMEVEIAGPGDPGERRLPPFRPVASPSHA